MSSSDLEDSTDWGQDADQATRGGQTQPVASKQRCVIHLDLDCFYAQAEAIRDPGLRSHPVGVRQKNIVITTNYAARRMGAPKSGMVKDFERQFPQVEIRNRNLSTLHAHHFSSVR